MKRSFIRVECPSCGHKQSIFTKPTSRVICNSCGTTVAEPTGGIGDFKGRLLSG